MGFRAHEKSRSFRRQHSWFISHWLVTSVEFWFSCETAFLICFASFSVSLCEDLSPVGRKFRTILSNWRHIKLTKAYKLAWDVPFCPNERPSLIILSYLIIKPFSIKLGTTSNCKDLSLEPKTFNVLSLPGT